VKQRSVVLDFRLESPFSPLPKRIFFSERKTLKKKFRGKRGEGHGYGHVLRGKNMYPLQQMAWILPEECPFAELYAALEEGFSLKTGRQNKELRIWYDTFDWRIFRKKKVLLRVADRWILQDFQGNVLGDFSSRRKKMFFAQDFPASPFREALQPLLGVRGLHELGQEEVVNSAYAVLNRDNKIVALLEVRQSMNGKTGRKRVSVHLREVRGYGKWFRQVAAFMDRFGEEASADPGETLAFVLEGSDRQVLDYSSAYAVALEPKMPGIQALVRIYSALLENIRRNEQGAIDGRDTEFLHDLRVAVRRTRSALALTKEVLPVELSERFKKDFRTLGQLTGPVRDLDVYLLSEAEYKAKLPERLQEGLGYFFADLADKRKEEQRLLAQALRGLPYQQILQDWTTTLEALKTEQRCGSKGEVAIKILADALIRKRLHRLLRDGRKIDPGSPDSALHRLRIEGKKLRYALEFFASLYDRRQMKLLISQLKMLQNNLGDFNDLSVQQEMLGGYLSRLRPGSKKTRETAAAVGGLMTDLSGRHLEVRGRFERTFARFTAKENRVVVRELFGEAV